MAWRGAGRVDPGLHMAARKIGARRRHMQPRRAERMTKGVLQPNGTTVAEPRMDVSAVANAILYMDSLPLDANVQFMTVMATKMPYVGRG